MKGKLWPVIQRNEAPPPLVIPHGPVRPQGKPVNAFEGSDSYASVVCSECNGTGLGKDDA